jgi:hypothetical protein
LLFALAVAENARAAMQLSATSMPSRRSPDVFKPGHLQRCVDLPDSAANPVRGPSLERGGAEVKAQTDSRID